MRSKLWRRLGATAPVFNVTSPHGTWDDHSLTSMSLSLGSAMAGISTSTAEVEVRWEIGSAPSSDQTIKVTLTPYGETLLAGLTGQPADRLRARFSGRIAGQTVTDRGDDKIRTTKVDAQDYLALISQLDRGAMVVRDFPALSSLYRSLFFTANLPNVPELEQWGSKWHQVRFTPEEAGSNSKAISTGDVVGRYAADVGNLIRQRRNNQPQGIAHDHIVSMADDWRIWGEHPLQRAQVRAPVSWVQATTVPVSLSWDQWDAPGSTTQVTWTITVGDPGHVTKGEHLDMTHIWVIGGETGLHDAMTARVSAAAADWYRVEKVTVDILKLLRPDSEGGTPVDRAQAGQLLVKEHGDVLTLGYDWPPNVAGVYFIKSLTETITPDSWLVDLDLLPANHVTGRPRPSDIAGSTWDTAYPQHITWDEPSTTWEDSP